jgi:hypothetical protein
MREDIWKGRNERCSSCNGKTRNRKERKGVGVNVLGKKRGPMAVEAEMRGL